MNILSFNKPCVLRLTPGKENDAAIITVFDVEEDATAFWKADDELMSSYEPASGYNHLHLDGEINIEYFEHIVVRYWSHNDLQKYLDELCADWCLKNNWFKRDREAALFVCGDSMFDEEYLFDEEECP